MLYWRFQSPCGECQINKIFSRCFNFQFSDYSEMLLLTVSPLQTPCYIAYLRSKHHPTPNTSADTLTDRPRMTDRTRGGLWELLLIRQLTGEGSIREALGLQSPCSTLPHRESALTNTRGLPWWTVWFHHFSLLSLFPQPPYKKIEKAQRARSGPCDPSVRHGPPRNHPSMGPRPQPGDRFPLPRPAHQSGRMQQHTQVGCRETEREREREMGLV